MAALCVPGFILRKRKMLPETAVAALVAVLIYVSQPVLTVSGFMEKDYDPSLLPNMAIVLLGSFVVHFAAYLVARLVFKAMPAGDEEKDRANRVGTICSFMGNVGFMGIPVVKALFPNNPEMLIYVAIINVSFNVVSWTLGVYTITGDKSNVSIRRAFLNPPTVALVAALPLFFYTDRRFRARSVVRELPRGNDIAAQYDNTRNPPRRNSVQIAFHFARRIRFYGA